MNGLSVLAAYGTLVLVFQHGWLAKLLGFTPPGCVSSPSVVLLCAVLGLSTGYAVLLLSRIKKSYAATGKTEEAVAAGLQQTADPLTGSALITLVIFGTFALNGMVAVKELGAGLFVAVLLDATLIRMILVPAFMRLLGDWNWRGLRQDIAGGSNPYVQD
jgi:RND superfamily putative drug exporter